jgi:hypothetical protein
MYANLNGNYNSFPFDWYGSQFHLNKSLRVVMSLSNKHEPFQRLDPLEVEIVEYTDKIE